MKNIGKDFKMFFYSARSLGFDPIVHRTQNFNCGIPLVKRWCHKIFHKCWALEKLIRNIATGRKYTFKNKKYCIYDYVRNTVRLYYALYSVGKHFKTKKSILYKVRENRGTECLPIANAGLLDIKSIRIPNLQFLKIKIIGYLEWLSYQILASLQLQLYLNYNYLQLYF